MAIAKLTKEDRAEIEVLLAVYDSALHTLIKVLVEIHDGWEEEIENQSKKWRESPEGVEAQNRSNTLRDGLNELPDDLPFIDLDALL